MPNTRLSPPWCTYANKIIALFGGDPEITIISDLDASAPEVDLYVSNQAKADAIDELLPNTVKFGNVELRIDVIPSNDIKTPASLIKTAFNGNPAFKYIKETGEFGFKATYGVFAKEVVQFYNDNLADVNGNWTGLYSEIADEILNIEDIYFCTDNK